jgi:hypothetical protein
MTASGAILSGKGTADDLLRLQALAAHSLIIGTTRKCPLSCGHCITSSSPKAGGATLSLSLAKVWAEDLGRMHADGLQHITFTGGEPILTIDAVAYLCHVARELGISTYIATSGAWARSPRAAKRVVRKIGSITNWDFGVDGWHAAEMPLQVTDNALTAVMAAGGSATVRLCESPTEDATRRMEAEVVAMVKGRAPIMRQSVRAIGRASAKKTPTATGLPERPCISTGLFVRGDGSTGPCCAGLSYEEQGVHPFDYGVIRQPTELYSAWMAWRRDPLLRIMRLASMAALNGWLSRDTAPISFPEDPCEACVTLWSRIGRKGGMRIRGKALAPGISRKLDLLESVLFAGEINDQACTAL